jgi:hypothetical protein
MSITEQIAARFHHHALTDNLRRLGRYGIRGLSKQPRYLAATLYCLSTIMQWSPKQIPISSTARYWNG